MKVHILRGSTTVYSCLSYLIRGTWNRLEDVNALVDVGTDGSIIPEIERVYAGVGKRAVTVVVLTHGHFDHIGGLTRIVARWKPHVYALAKLDGVTRLLKDGEVLRLGDCWFEVIRAPGHSNDSLCLYCSDEKALFAGDTPVRVRSPGGSYEAGYVQLIERLVQLDIRTIYGGHDDPITEGARQILADTLNNVTRSHIGS